MKKLCFFLFFLIGMLSAQSSSAQANNNTSENWVINYYGAETYVYANDTNVPINVGTACSEGINVRSLDATNCGHDFSSGPDTWTGAASCSNDTDNVVFESNGPGPACFTPTTTYGDPEFTFN